MPNEVIGTLGGDSLTIKGNFLRAMYPLTKPSLSYGKSEDDETPQSGFLEVDDNVTSLGLRLLVPPKTFCDVIDTSTSCASKAQREPVESVRLAWRSRCHLQPHRFHLSLICLNTNIASVSILFLLTNAIYCTTINLFDINLLYRLFLQHH